MIKKQNNYDIIKKLINDILNEIYKDMDDYLENIINSPSTINKIFKYYSIGVPEDPTIHEKYLMFGEKIVRIYVIEDPSPKCEEMIRGILHD